MLAHAVFICISVHAVLLQAVSARSVLPYNNYEVDADSISIDIETNSRYYAYTAGQLMNFSCILKGGLEQYANLSLSIDGAVNKSESFGKRMVSLSKVAEESDNDKYLRCYMWYEGFQDPHIYTRFLTIIHPPRAGEELQNGTYKAIGDFRVGEGANVTVRFRANPKPHLVTWKMNGRHLDSDRFKPWTSDQIWFQDGTWVAVLSILQVQLHDFLSVFHLEVINDQGSTTIPVKMHLQEIDEEPSGWSIVRLTFLVVICVPLIIIIGYLPCCFALKLRKRFEEISTIDELRQLKSASSIPQKEFNLQNVITHEPMANLKEQNSQRIADDRLNNAVRAGNEEEVRKLLEGGTDVETKIKNGSNSLHIAAQKSTNDQQPANLFAQQEEANHLNVGTHMTNLKKQNSQTIAGNEKSGKVVTGAELINAVRAGNEEEVRKLLEGGADVETKIKNGSNSLHIAAQKGFLEIVKLLCEKVQNIDATNDKNKTALMYATEKGHLEVVKYLLQEWEVDVSLVDDEGNTLLHMAVASGKFTLIKFFVESNHKVPDVNAINKKFETALKIADVYRKKDIFAYLQLNCAK